MQTINDWFTRWVGEIFDYDTGLINDGYIVNWDESRVKYINICNNRTTVQISFYQEQPIIVNMDDKHYFEVYHKID